MNERGLDDLTTDELKEAMKTAKNRKAMSNDSNSMELLKYEESRFESSRVNFNYNNDKLMIFVK